MKIDNLLNVPGVITYEVYWRRGFKSQLVQYRIYTLKCFNRVQIERNEYEFLKGKVTHCIFPWEGESE